MQVRRVVTGHNEAGKAVVISDGFLPSISPDEGDKWSVWAADRPVTFPDGGDPPPFGGPLLPRPGGFHVVVYTLPSNFNPDMFFAAPTAAKMGELARAHTKTLGDSHPIVDDPNPPGSYGMVPGASAMHATSSIDCLMQVSGESIFVLEDAEVRLRPGDWVIVNGVMHSWRNDLDEPSVMIGVVYGVHHNGAPLRRH